jgi:predicted DNA-binding protein YlxM (UPF0122 family)
MTNMHLTTQELKARNEVLINLVDSGDYSLAEIGEMLSISRERVRQKYFDLTGRSVTAYAKKRREEKERKQKEKLNSVKFICAGCGKPVTYGERGNAVKYCEPCYIDVKKNQRKVTVTYRCENPDCQKIFHPFRSIFKDNKSTMQRHFCNSACYLKMMAGIVYSPERRKKSIQKRKDILRAFSELKPRYKKVTATLYAVSKKLKIPYGTVNACYYRIKGGSHGKTV